MRWSDLLERATPSLLSQVHSMQQRIQFDEPVNIQFTSVYPTSNLHNLTIQLNSAA